MCTVVYYSRGKCYHFNRNVVIWLVHWSDWQKKILLLDVTATKGWQRCLDDNDICENVFGSVILEPIRSKCHQLT